MESRIEFKQSAFRHGVSEADIRHAFTNPRYDGLIEDEEEAVALDEYYTNNPPKVDPSKARIRIPMVRVDSHTAECLQSLAKASHKTPEEIVSELVMERYAAL